MKYFYLLLLGFITPLISFAQSNYKPGYTVSLNGDTTKGYINYRQWDKNPGSVSFKKDINVNIVNEITIKNCEAFGISGLEYFELKTVHISQAQVQQSNIKQGVDSSYLIKTVFLRVLIKGKNVALYDYTDDIKTRYYYQENTIAEPIELIYRNYFDALNSNYERTDYTFRSQLQMLAQKFSIDNSRSFSMISPANYYETDLIRIVRLINGDQDKQFVPAKLFGFRTFTGAGITVNTMGFKGALKYPNSNSTWPKIDAGVDIFLNKTTQKVYLRAELMYSQNSHSFSYGPDMIDYSSSLKNLTQHTISFSPQVILNVYNTNDFKFFIDAGVSANTSLYSNYEFKESYNGVQASDLHKYPDLVGFWFTLPVKAGVVFNNHFELYAGYSFKTIITNNYDAFAGYLTQYQAGFNYLFGVK